MSASPSFMDQLNAAANCAGSFLMLVLFVVLTAGAVALHFALRGLRSARGELPDAMALLEEQAKLVEAGAATSTAAVVRPQVTLASRIAGLRAGVRAALRGPQPPAVG